VPYSFNSRTLWCAPVDARSLLPNGHHLLHGFGQLDVFHLEPFDGDAPRSRRRGDPFTQQCADPITLLANVVEIVLADDVAQVRERELIDGALALSTAMTDRAASTTRYQSTAFTLMVTLSRVIVSYCSASTVRMRMSMMLARRWLPTLSGDAPGFATMWPAWLCGSTLRRELARLEASEGPGANGPFRRRRPALERRCDP
jgi:hypothetical protein